MIVQLIAGPVMGLIIGYITNNIAIKMLFRPHSAKYIGSHRVPFTPGLIPKEKERIATTLGSVISNELLSSDTMYDALLSDKILSGIRGLIDRGFERMKAAKTTLREALYQKTDKQLVDSMIGRLGEDVTNLIHDRLSKFNFGTEISKKVIIAAREKYKSGGSFKAMLAGMIDDNVVDSLAEPLGRTIDRLVSENSETIVGDVLKNEVDRIMDTPTREIAEKLAEQKPRLADAAVDIYVRTIKNDLPKILDTLNLAKIVENKINAYNVREFEDLLFSIMKKELSAIVWLGALLGFIMGFVNAFISFI